MCVCVCVLLSSLVLSLSFSPRMVDEVDGATALLHETSDSGYDEEEIKRLGEGVTREGSEGGQ